MSDEALPAAPDSVPAVQKHPIEPPPSRPGLVTYLVLFAGGIAMVVGVIGVFD